MSIAGAFQPIGLTATLQTNASASTSDNYQLLPSAFGLTNFPQQVRFINNGTADIWVALANATGTAAAFPTIAAGGTGTPTAGWRLKPGVVEVFTIPGGPALFISDISASTSQSYDVTFGEGL
jgi:hypothetical protein